MKGMATCKVCGRDFALMAEESYIVRDNKPEKGLSQALSGLEEPKIYDAFDCPHCGCQYIAQERKRLLEISCLVNEEKHEESCNEEEKYEGSCVCCKHFGKWNTDDPCKDCNHMNGKFNKFEQTEG